MTTAQAALIDLDLPVDDVIGVWCDLESALAGKSGFGGDVAEIYAYRLVPSSQRHHAQGAEVASVAGKNMTRLLRLFVDLHAAVIAIEAREGFQPIDLAAEEFPPFLWRVHLRVSPIALRAVAPAIRELPSIRELREAIAKTAEHAGMLTGMLDELAASRAKERLHADAQDPADTSDLPPDGATGLYLDRSFAVDDLEWIKMAWDAYQARSSSGNPARASQIMLVFQAIRRDERATTAFLVAMNTIVLPLLRRIRLKAQPNLSKLGTANE